MQINKLLKTAFLLSFFLFLGTHLFAQRIITGIITDDSGEPLIGASVLVKGTTIGTVTDLDGSYRLEIPEEGTYKLVISYTGYATKEVKIKKDSIINIELNEGLELTEVVVTGLGIKREKKAMGSSVTTIKMGNHHGGGNYSRKRNKKKRKNKKNKANTSQAAPSTIAHATNPVNHNTENYASITENRFYQTTKEPLSTFSIDVDAAAYSNVRRFLNQQQLPPQDAIRIEEMINYFNYDYPNPIGKDPFELVTELSDCPWNAAHQLLHVGLQGKKIEKAAIPPSNLVFLIDVSGSMDYPSKLPLLKDAFKLLVEELRPIDTVAIVVYAGASGLVLPATSGKDKATINAMLSKLEAGGSTAGAEGLELAYQTAEAHFIKEGNNRVILATDGDFNVGISSEGGLVRLIEQKRKKGVFLSVLGFGMGNYQDAKMQLLADKGNGNHAYIDNLQEAKKVLVEEFTSTLFTIAKDVKLQLEFNPAYVQGYRLIGYENRLLENEDFNDDQKDAGELGAGHTVTALYELIPSDIKSAFMPSVDPLKYQKIKSKKANKWKGELLTLKLRYKQPQGASSELSKAIIPTQTTPLTQTSNNFRFSAAVASFGMLLRDSKYKKDASYTATIDLAKNSVGKDEHGYRAEFLELLTTAKALSAATGAVEK